MSKNQENTMQVPVPPQLSCMDWLNENKLMVILVILAIAAAIWYFWFREDADDLSLQSPELTTPPGGKSFNIIRMRR